MVLTFVLLGMSICAVWLPAIRISEKRIAPWLILFACAVVSGLLRGYLKPVAIVELGVFAVCAHLAGNSDEKNLRRLVFSILTLIGALALAMHLLPGFNNPIIAANVKFSEDAAMYTQYLNFDKGAVGLILVAILCARAHALADWGAMLRRAVPVAIATSIIVILTALLSGFVKFEFKISSYTLLFLVTNLLFTCVAEEAFFRGFVQDRLAASLRRFHFGGATAIACSAILFGLSHTGGGVRYVIMATLVGLGSAYAYSITRRIEAPIITHFCLNAVHFVWFTYPHLE